LRVLIKAFACMTDALLMIRPFSQPRTLGVEGIVLKQPSAATGNQWQVEIRQGQGAAGCAHALNASFAKEQRDIAENYAKRMMRIFRTDRLERVA
jgi:hypothetical protein